MTLDIFEITKSFGTVRAVDEFTLSLNGGELVVLLGPSGCGKTTVIRIVAGLETPESGKVIMSGEDWTGIPPQKRDVAMVFQQYALYPQRTVKGNIEYPLRLRGMETKERDERIDRVSSLLGLSSLLNRKPSELSGGEAQRVALARAIVREPSCFLMDEPLSNLDAQLRVKARAEIKRLQRHLKVTTLYVTHDQDEAVALADRIAIMNDGKLIQVGTSEQIFHQPATSFVAGFLGRPPINLLPAQVISVRDGLAQIGLDPNDGDNYKLSVGIREAVTRGQKLKVGFRPDHVNLVSEGQGDQSEAGWFIPGTLVLVEGLEPEYIAHCDTPVGTILIRTAHKPAEGPAKLFLPAAKAHYFDAETGKRLE
jgi:multiple sugar transport system ATP-binding protein